MLHRKTGSKAESPWTGFGAVAPMNQSFLNYLHFYASLPKEMCSGGTSKEAVDDQGEKF